MGTRSREGLPSTALNITIEKDLRGLFGSARDQDPRPTCMAFAASDVHAGVRRGWEPLSVEWAYYHALKREGVEPHEGVSLAAMLTTLREDGQPKEAIWPYMAYMFTDVASYVPPSTTEPIYRRGSRRVAPDIDIIVRKLNEGHPMLVTMSISSSFFCAPQTASSMVASRLKPIVFMR